MNEPAIFERSIPLTLTCRVGVAAANSASALAGVASASSEPGP